MNAIGLRVGVDLVPLSRARALIERPSDRVLRHMLCSEEQGLLCHPDHGWDVEGVAGRLAAKEAVFKLLSADRQPLPWCSIAILPGWGRRPVVRLDGRALQLATRAGLGPVDVSISHDGDYAIAVAAAAASPPNTKGTP